MEKDWKEFAEQALDCAIPSKINVVFDGLDSMPISACTLINRALLKQVHASGAPGLVVSVCDYTREAIAFSYGLSLLDSLNAENRMPYDPASWASGDRLGICGSNFEFLGLSDRDEFGKMVSYVMPGGGKKSQALSFIPGRLQKCSDDAKLMTKRKGRLSEGIAAYRSLSPVAQAFYDQLSFVEKPVAYVTSKSSFSNIAPTRLRNAMVEVDGVELLPMTSCLKTGYISTAGEVKEYCDYPIGGKPAVITTCRDEEGIGDLYYILEYLDSGNELSAVVVEAPEPEAVDGMFSHLEDISSANVPIIVFCDERTMLNTDSLDQLGLAKFSWSQEALREAREIGKSYGLGLTHRENCLVSRAVRLSPVDDAANFPKISETFYRLNANRSRLTDKGKQALTSLTRLLNTGLKQTEIILQDVSDDRISRIDSAEKTLTDVAYDCSLSADEVADLKRATSLLRQVFRPNVALPKEDAAYEGIRHSLLCGRHVCLITSSSVSANEATTYWREIFEDEDLPSDLIRALTVWEFLKEDCISDNEDVFICGWYSRDVMERLVGSGLSRVYSILLYKGSEDIPLETNWYIHASDYWRDRQNKAKRHSSSTLRRCGVNPSTSLTPSTKPSNGKAAPPPPQDDSFSFMVEKMDEERAESEGAIAGEESFLARPVYFTNGCHRWLRVPDSSSQLGGDKLVVIDSFGGEGIDYSKKTAAALHEGDMVLKTSRDDDALDELCRESFGSYEATLEVARSWRKPIDEARKQISDVAIRDKIKAAGSKKTEQTIMSWIRGDRVIAPNKKRDIVAISKAFGDCFSEGEISRIIQAVRIVKGTRINSGKSITSTIVEAFIKDADEYGLRDAALHFEDRHDMGTVDLLSVEHVGRPQVVGISRFGYYID